MLGLDGYKSLGDLHLKGANQAGFRLLLLDSRKKTANERKYNHAKPVARMKRSGIRD
jgi:hypothetical protein